MAPCTSFLWSVIVAWTCLWPAAAGAAVFHSKESAIKAAFPDAERVDARPVYLSTEDVEWVGRVAGATPTDRVVTAYVGLRGGQAIGYGFIDTHLVRSLPESVLIVVSPAGEVVRTLQLAFHEPPEYQASPRWLSQFTGRRLEPQLAIGRGVDVITGASMTARALTTAHRRVLALWERKLSAGANRTDVVGAP
ncbi:FMN-binding protein [Myxococcota bacterium]|nr:FMN-binding protein [Myxococcota bacterium]